MQESAIALMQMTRSVLGVHELKKANLPYIVVMTNPTAGGVTASFAGLGDILIGEPKAIIAFLQIVPITSYFSFVLSKLIAEICQYKGVIEWDTSKPDGTPRKKLDISKIKQIGWKPKTDLATGIKLAINSYKRHYLKK